MSRHALRASAAAAALLAAALCGGAANAQVRAQDRAQAAREHPALLAEFGGEYPGAQQDYVRRVGDRMADAAGLSRQCTFTVVNTDVVNAFAVPGCYVYVTRGLLGVVNSEDELAFVIGHEIGHITGKHSQKRQQSSLITGLGALLLGAVTKNADLGQLLGQGAQLYTLKYSRDQEYQADDLGAQYLSRAGYSTAAAATTLDDLQRYDALQSQLRGQNAMAVPVWASSHPASAERIRRAAGQARTPYGADVAYGALQSDRYLAAVDGMVFGDDPQQGFVRGSSFLHPVLRIAFDAPSGFELSNSAQAVTMTGRNGEKAQFSGGRMTSTSLEAHAQAVLQQLIGNTPARFASPQRTTVNGLETVVQQAQVQTNGGLADVSVAAYRTDRDTAYQFVTLAPSGRGYAFDSLIRSMRRLGDREAADLRARRIRVVTARGGETVQQMARQMAVDRSPAQWFALLNDLPQDATLRAGQRVKIVVDEAAASSRTRSDAYRGYEDPNRYDDRSRYEDQGRYDDRNRR